MLLWDTEIISLGMFSDVPCLFLLPASYRSVISQFYKVCPSIITTWRNPILEENCWCCFKSAWLCILYFWISSHPCSSGPQGHLSCLPFNTVGKYSSVLMMSPKITMSMNFISMSPTSLLWELIKSLNATDNSFLINILLVYCDLNIYPPFYYSSLSSLISFSFHHHVKCFAEIRMY